MKRRSNRNQRWMAVAATSVLVASYVYFGYMPMTRQISELKSQLAEAEIQAAGTVQLVAALDATGEQLNTVSEYVDAWREAAPSEHELAELFERIYKLTRLAETETTRFEPQTAIPYETFVRIPLSMECQGNFAQLARVLTGLENMREPIWLKSVELQSTGEDSELVTAEIILDVFADNLEDSDQDNLSGEPITQETDQSSIRL